MTTKKQLLKEARITIRENRRIGLHRVTQNKFSGPTRADITVGEFATRDLAIEAGAEAAISYRSFERSEWEAAR